MHHHCHYRRKLWNKLGTNIYISIQKSYAKYYRIPVTVSVYAANLMALNFIAVYDLRTNFTFALSPEQLQGFQ